MAASSYSLANPDSANTPYRAHLKRRPDVGSSQPVAVVAQPALIYPFPRPAQKPAAGRTYNPYWPPPPTQPKIDKGIAAAVLRAHIASKREAQDTQFLLALLPREVADEILRYYAWEPPAPPPRYAEPSLLSRTALAPAYWGERYNGRQVLLQPQQTPQHLEAEYAAFMRELSVEAPKKQVQPTAEGLIAKLARLARFQQGRRQ